MKNITYIILISLIFFQSCYFDSRSRQEASRFPNSVQGVDAVKLKNSYTSNDYTTNNLSHDNTDRPLSSSSNSKRQLWEFWPLFKFLNGQSIEQINLIQGDEFTKRKRYLDAKDAYFKSRGKDKTLEYRKALVLRLASTELSLGNPKASLAALSSFIRRIGSDANSVDRHFALMLAFSYSRMRDFNQGLAWFSRAHELASPGSYVFSATDRGLKSLLETVSDESFNELRLRWSRDVYVNGFIVLEAQRRARGGMPVTENNFWETYKPEAIEQHNAGHLELANIAVMLPFSGKFATLGEAMKNGFELALDGQGLRNKISVNYFDTAGDPAIAASIARSFISRSATKPDFVFGPLLGETSSSVNDILKRSDIPVLVFSKSDNFQAGANVFRLGATMNSQVTSLVEAIFSATKMKRFAIIYPETAQGQAYASLFKEMVLSKYGNIVYEGSYLPKDAQSFIGLSSELALLESKPQAIFFPDTLHMASKLLIALPEGIRLGVRLLGTAKWDDNQQLVRSKTLFKNIIFPNPFFEISKNKFISQFVKTYRKTYRHEPGFLAAQSFDSGTILLNSVLDAYRNKTTSQQAFENIDTYSGLTGNIKVTESGELKRIFKVVELKDKGLRLLQ